MFDICDKFFSHSVKEMYFSQIFDSGEIDSHLYIIIKIKKQICGIVITLFINGGFDQNAQHLHNKNKLSPRTCLGVSGTFQPRGARGWIRYLNAEYFGKSANLHQNSAKYSFKSSSSTSSV